MLMDVIKKKYHVDPARLRRAQALVNAGEVHYHEPPIGTVIHGKNVSIYADGTVSCSCPDWKTRGSKTSPQTPCKHILALAIAMDAANVGLDVIPEPEPTRPVKTDSDGGGFGEKVRKAVDGEISALARRIGKVMESTVRPPLLLGPTGTGKTSAMQKLAVANGWGMETVQGTPSWSDPDLVGLKLRSGAVVGPVTRAMRRAQFGEDVLLFMDEFYQLSQRAQALSLHLFQPLSPDVARAMGIDADGPIYRIETPMWGVEWAPAGKLHIAAAANPWGTIPSPAVVRRTVPVMVDFSENVSKLFSKEVRSAIELSWQATKDGSLPLPMEYGLLIEAKAPNDISIVQQYVEMLRAMDVAAAEGFVTLLKGEGIKM